MPRPPMPLWGPIVETCHLCPVCGWVTVDRDDFSLGVATVYKIPKHYLLRSEIICLY